MDENKKLEFRGSSFMALVPFAIFIVITIALSFFNAADTNKVSFKKQMSSSSVQVLSVCWSECFSQRISMIIGISYWKV